MKVYKKYLVFLSIIILSIAIVSSFNNVDIKSQLNNINTLNIKELRFTNTKDVKEQIDAIVSTSTNKDLILFDEIYLDKETNEYVFSAIYDSSELNELFDSYSITDLDSFNKFIATTNFEEFSSYNSPTDLFNLRKGNCYAYTLLTMYYIDKYESDIEYDIILEEISSLHMYLKLFNKNSQNSVISDLTKNKNLELPQ